MYLRGTICMVSTCTRSPGFKANGRASEKCHRFHGERGLINPFLLSVRFTELKLTETPSLKSSWWTISAHRFRFLRCSKIACTISGGSALGCEWGREERVAKGILPYHRSCFTHLTTVLCSTPKWRATFLLLQP